MLIKAEQVVSCSKLSNVYFMKDHRTQTNNMDSKQQSLLIFYFTC